MRSVLPQHENEVIAIDALAPLPSSTAGVKYVFVILNVFTKFVTYMQLNVALHKF